MKKWKWLSLGLIVPCLQGQLVGEKIWQRSFEPVTFGAQEGPNNDSNFSGGKGSGNLAVNGGQLAVVGTTRPGDTEGYVLSVLKTENGSTVFEKEIRQKVGNTRSYNFPWKLISASGDNVPGLLNLYWDTQSGILFTAQGAYESSYTAYDFSKPESAGAFAGQLQDHPGLQDAFGRTRSEMYTQRGTAVGTPGMEADIWGLGGSWYADGPETDKGKRRNMDEDWMSVWGNQGSSYYNSSKRVALDPEGPWIATTKGAGWGHNQAGHFYLFNKYTGLKALPATPAEPKNQQGIALRPFSSGGVLFSKGNMFLMGPGEDRNGDGQLGARRPEGWVPKMDQGLAIWSYRIEGQDLKENDGLTGGGTLETAVLTPGFAYDFPSRYKESEDIDSYGQSWYETDGFYRPKPMVADGDGVWVSWKPSQAEGVELVYADANGTRQIDLGVGKGMKGVSLWPHLEMAETGSGKKLVYYTPNSWVRKRVMPEDIDAFMAPFGEGRGTITPWAELAEDRKEKIRREIRNAGAWSGELSGPQGSAWLAVADPVSGEVLWTDEVSARTEYLYPNGFWTYIERSQMVVQGDEAVVAFVNNGEGESKLTLLVYSLEKADADPKVLEIPLGFDGTLYNGSALTDLVATEDGLFALVTQGKVFSLRDPRWQQQHVLRIR